MSVNIIKAIEHPDVFGNFLGNLDTWQNWLLVLRAIYGLPIDDEAQDLFYQCAARGIETLPDTGFDTTLLLTGRRSGKSRITSVILAYEAVFGGHEKKLAKGETGVVLLTSPTKRQSKIVRDYVRAIFETSPVLNKFVKRESTDGLELTNGINIEVIAGDPRTVRGHTVVAAVVDEAAHFGYAQESNVRSDTELIRSIEPSLLTTEGKLIAISTPFGQRGWCYEQWQKYFGTDDPSTLVWNSPSRTMNPGLSQKIIDRRLAEDPVAARSEYFGEWRDDKSFYVTPELAYSLVVKGRIDLPFQPGRKYAAFCDMSGGRSDASALAIAHMEGDKVVLDYLEHHKAPHKPIEVVGLMAQSLRRYGLDTVTGDNYSAEWNKGTWESFGIRYERATFNDFNEGLSAIRQVQKPKNQLYLDLLPRLTSGQIELLDNEILLKELIALERRPRTGGRDTIDHPKGGHDDLINAVAGVADAVKQDPISAGVLESGDNSTQSPLGREVERRLAQRRELEMEERLLDRPEDHQAEFRELMYRFGRTNLYSGD